MISFDPTVSVGAIINLLGLIVTASIMVVGLHWRLRAVEGKLGAMERVLEALARQDERLKALDRAVDDMKHGRGFVFEPVVGRLP